MLSISQISGDGSYYTSLAQERYYLHDQARSEWMGVGAERLGLSGEVKAEDFKRLLAGFHPRTGEPLVQNAGAEKRQLGWDLTGNAPKAVSTGYAVSPLEVTLKGMSPTPNMRHEFAEAHIEAIRRMQKYLDGVAGRTRRGKGGLEREAVNLVAAAFHEYSNRNGEPHIHTHLIVLNLAERADGSFGTIVSQDLYRHKMAAGAIYRAELAHQLRRRLGLKLTPQRIGFGIEGIPDTLNEAFSQRRAEIEAALDGSGFSGPQAARVAAENTRAAKKRVAPDVLFQEWAETGARHGLCPERVLALRQPGHVHRPPRLTPEIVHGEIERLLNHQSFFSERELVRRLAEHSPEAGIPARHILGTARRATAGLIDLGVHQHERKFTTQAMLDLECELVRNAVTGQHDRRHGVAESVVAQAIAARQLSEEQKGALKHITLEAGTIRLVHGLAGTGKSVMLDAAREAWTKAGYQVIGCALAGKAVEGLQKSSGIESHTIARLLLQWGRTESAVRPLSPRSVLVVDEAGMVGTRQLKELLDQAVQAGAKVVLVGDTKQLPAIQAGSPFNALSQLLGEASLTDIRRQVTDWGRTAVKRLAEGQVRAAINILQDKGLVQVAPTREEATRQLLREWSHEPAPERVLMLAGTHEEVAWLNRGAQQQRRASGLTGKQTCLIGGKSFHPGDRLLFGRNDRKLGVTNGTLGTLVGEREGSAVVHLDNGRTAFIPTNHEHVRLGYAVTTHKSQGTTVDRAFVLFSDTMQSREATYVQVSRARHSAKLFLSEDQAGDPELSDAIRAMERSQAKGMALDLANLSILDSERQRRERSRSQSITHSLT